jgi:hypothetical protein
LIILLRRLDLLRWHEQVTIWEPTTRLFRSMGRRPYVPREVIAQGRYRPSGLVRVVDYPDPYPVRSTKIVTVEDLDGVVEPPVVLDDLPSPAEPDMPAAGHLATDGSGAAGPQSPDGAATLDNDPGAYRIQITASDLLEKLLTSIEQATAGPSSDGM